MNQNNKIFIAASLANGASISMILPLLAPLIRQMNMAEWQGGALVSAGALLMAISAIYISKQKDRLSIYGLLSLGFVGMTMTWAIFTGLLSYGLEGHIVVGFLFILLILARAVSGIFMAMPQIALQTYVMTNYVDEKQRSQTMSKFGALNSLGVIVGPLLTTLLLAWGMLTPLWFSLIIFILISFYIVLGFNRHADQSNAQSDQQRVDQRNNLDDQDVFSYRNSMIWFVLGFSLYIAIVTVNLTAGFYIQDHFKVSPQQSAVYFSQCSLIVGVTLVVVQTAISKFLEWSVQRLLWVGLISMLLGLVITLCATQVWIFQSAYVLYGVAVACLIPAFTTGAAQSAPQHLQAKIASLCTATQALSFVFAPLLSTVLYQWHQTVPYLLLIGLMMGLLLYFLIQNLKDRKRLPI